MLGYLRSLEQVPAATRQAAEKPARKPYQPDPNFVDLDEQCRRFTNGLTPMQRRGVFTLDDILPQLKGRYAVRPASSRVSNSLIRLGWSKGRFEASRSLPRRRVWLPPPTAKA